MPRLLDKFARNSPAEQHETQEMILLTLARSEENGAALLASDLARELQLSAPALDANLRPLIGSNWLSVDSVGTLALTQEGRQRALALLRRHRLAERLFTDVLGMDWARAHEEADKLEHTFSAEAEKKLADQLGDPDTCPHGNPIPSVSGDAANGCSQSLADCAPQARGTIFRIGLETPTALQHLATLGLLPNVEIEVENKAPFNGPVMVRVGRAHYALGRELAARIWVKTTD